jgi:hypothetical protein
MHREFWCGNQKQKRTIFRPRLRLKNGIKMALKEHYRRFERGLSGSATAHTGRFKHGNGLLGFKKWRDF